LGCGVLTSFWVQSTDESPWIYATLATNAVMQLILIGIILYYRRKRSGDEAGAHVRINSDNSFDDPRSIGTSNNRDLATPLLSNEEDTPIVRFADEDTMSDAENGQVVSLIVEEEEERADD